MKKLLTMALITLMAASVFAKKYTGVITRVMEDEEVTKVVVSDTFMLMASKGKPQYASLVQKANEALASQKKAIVEADDSTEIISIQVQK